MLKIKEKTFVFSTETSLGEPQGWWYLKDGTSIEVTHEENGLSAKDQYYSVRQHCSEEDFENGKYHQTCGVIEQFYCPTLDDVKDVLGIYVDVVEEGA